MAKKKQVQIDWTRAPQWAQWFAIDWNREGFFYDDKPVCEKMVWAMGDGRLCKYAGKYSDWMHWRESLQQRPKE